MSETDETTLSLSLFPLFSSFINAERKRERELSKICRAKNIYEERERE